MKEESERVRAHFVVTGRVQGVFYRVACREEAVRLQVDGWVRNTPDGSVEGVAEGSRARVEQLIAWCRRGPPAARVKDVNVEWTTPSGEKGFRIPS